MKNTILVNKYSKIKDEISQCIPKGAEVIVLDTMSVLVTLPSSENRREVLKCCREAIGEKRQILIQPVINYTETADSIEVAIPEMKRFFQRLI